MGVVEFAQSGSVSRVSSIYCATFSSGVLGEVRSVTGLGFLLGGSEQCGVASALGPVCFVGLRFGCCIRGSVRVKWSADGCQRLVVSGVCVGASSSDAKTG